MEVSFQAEGTLCEKLKKQVYNSIKDLRLKMQGMGGQQKRQGTEAEVMSRTAVIHVRE